MRVIKNVYAKRDLFPLLLSIMIYGSNLNKKNTYVRRKIAILNNSIVPNSIPEPKFK